MTQPTCMGITVRVCLAWTNLLSKQQQIVRPTMAMQQFGFYGTLPNKASR
ncbi:MAG: hypothetical protein Q4A69_08940 [Moraxella sp.]|nr:hypothetical protein [Moraxella sp.]